jgi:CDP-4-dehydro-6-deoxyglucose reductase, E3
VGESQLSHRITLQPSGNCYEVGGDTTLLKAGLDAGLALAYSCCAGMCRTCQGRVISGSVEYNDGDPDALTEEMKANGFALMCVARPLSDCVIELIEISQQFEKPRILPCKVKAITRISSDVAIVTLRIPMNLPMRYLAGQYINILLEDGRRRSYSIAVSPSREPAMDLEIHIRHLAGGAFTDRVFETMKVGDKLQIEGPLGTFYLREDNDKPIIFLASGTGFGPIKAIIEYALRRGINRLINFYWGCRQKSDLYQIELPQKWAEDAPNFSFVPVLSDASPSDFWTGRTGLVHQAVLSDFPDLSNYQVYACGAPAMVEAARRDFSNICGLPADDFFADEFLTEADRAKHFG